jgi:hypothetical protein
VIKDYSKEVKGYASLLGVLTTIFQEEYCRPLFQQLNSRLNKLYFEKESIDRSPDYQMFIAQFKARKVLEVVKSVEESINPLLPFSRVHNVLKATSSLLEKISETKSTELIYGASYAISSLVDGKYLAIAEGKLALTKDKTCWRITEEDGNHKLKLNGGQSIKVKIIDHEESKYIVYSSKFIGVDSDDRSEMVK